MKTLRGWVLLAVAGAVLWPAEPVVAHAWQPLYCITGDDSDADRARTVYQIDAAGTLSTFAILRTGSEVSGLAVDAQGNVYTSTDAEGTDPFHRTSRIVRITPTGQTSIFATFLGPGVQRLAFDHKGNLYAAGGFEVTKISSDGKAKRFATVPAGEEPSIAGLAIGAYNNLYLSTVAGIVKVTSKGKQSIFASLRTDEHPGALAFDTRGNLLLASWNPDRILSFSPAGRRRTFIAVQDSAPIEALVLDEQGNIYAADYNRERIFKIGPGGSPVMKFALIKEPMSLAFGPAPKR